MCSTVEQPPLIGATWKCEGGLRPVLRLRAMIWCLSLMSVVSLVVHSVEAKVEAEAGTRRYRRDRTAFVRLLCSLRARWILMGKPVPAMERSFSAQRDYRVVGFSGKGRVLALAPAMH
jgi:hypothetical protein